MKTTPAGGALVSSASLTVTGTASITVTLDTTPPRARIAVPADGSVVNTAQVTVSGAVNGTVSGTVNAGEVTVTVNCATAAVSNRSFAAPDLPLVSGTNSITAVERDRAGNTSSHTIQVTFQVTASAAGRYVIESGEVVVDVAREWHAARVLKQAAAPGRRPWSGRMVRSRSGSRRAGLVRGLLPCC